LHGISASTSSKSNTLFYSNTFRLSPEDESTICLLELKPEKIDTLFNINTTWSTSFSFFDKEGKSIFYIHDYYDNYKLKSTFARIDWNFL